MSAGELFWAKILKVDFAEEFPKKKIMIVLWYDEKIFFFRKQSSNVLQQTLFKMILMPLF